MSMRLGNRHGTVPAWTAALGLAVIRLIGCAPASGDLMVAVAPEGWEVEIEAERAERDQLFREDPETPLMPEDVEGFRGLEYWAPDGEYRLAGPLHAYPEPERFQIPTTAGKLRPCERYGWVAFKLGGQRLTLQVYRLLDAVPGPEGSDLFLPFTDATTGLETYPAGRYVNLGGDPSGRYVLDFNRAFNPLCAYGSPERYACPVTPPENRLPVRVEAGERGWKKEWGKGDS